MFPSGEPANDPYVRSARGCPTNGWHPLPTWRGGRCAPPTPSAHMARLLSHSPGLTQSTTRGTGAKMSSPFETFDQIPQEVPRKVDDSQSDVEPPSRGVTNLTSVQAKPQNSPGTPDRDLPEPVIVARALAADPASRGYLGAHGATHLADLARDFIACFGGRICRGPDGIWVYANGVWSPGARTESPRGFRRLGLVSHPVGIRRFRAA